MSADLEETEAPLIRGLNEGAYNLIILLRPLGETDSGGKSRYRNIPFIRENLFVLLPSTHRLAKRKQLQLKDLAGEKILIYNKIGFWYSVCKKNPDAVFLEQIELSALREIVSASDLPSFRTNVTNSLDSIPSDKIAIRLSDPEMNVRFRCICLTEKEAEYAALFDTMEKR